MTADFLLIGSGLLAGAMNALAGGGSFVSLPALMAAGVPPVTANASSSLALYPGGAVSAWVYRDGLGPIAGVSLRWMAAVSVVGGLAGGVLLLATTQALFLQALQWLLLAATMALAFGRRIMSAIHGWSGAGRGLILTGQFILGIYGGYFGGAVGIMMMAFWSFVTPDDLKRLQGPRTVLVTAANTSAVLLFAATGAVGWREVLILAPAAAAGGYLGALLGVRLPSGVVRALTLILAVCVTAAFFVKAYG
ncbi:sulfite exporter TauE/SafE family protein [Novosphingobium sp. fls2-241-R2A-195]|uniref:sulfite exporter TauE/SafE family protein n=1 Tax=Novosphingobium sp. fls2-241-R2A-195 TaxID=3040296 RepID=UPI00254ADC83|nr:sulfite exporter TauE/SafE family protein [Novosphingobium sp. fls2-241-R2A-195]